MPRYYPTLSPQKNYLLYEVFPDSFGVYLAARDLPIRGNFGRLETCPPWHGLVEF